MAAWLRSVEPNNVSVNNQSTFYNVLTQAFEANLARILALAQLTLTTHTNDKTLTYLVGVIETE